MAPAPLPKDVFRDHAVESRISKLLKLLPFIFPFLLLLIALACNQKGEEARYVDFSKREEVGFDEDPNTITYAYVPQYFHRVSFELHNPLVEYLKRETDLPIRQVFPDSFDDFIKMFGQGKIDISFSNPFLYIKIARRFGAKAFARIIETNGEKYFRGQIISRSDNKRIESLQDCIGKRWVAVDPSSAGGYLYALGLFGDVGIKKEDFSEISFVSGPGGQQEKVVLAVLSGRYDIGSIREGTLDLMAERTDLSMIRVLAYTPWYPGWLYAARAGLDEQVLTAIKEAFLKLDCTSPEESPICGSARISGIISGEDGDFDSVRDLAAKAGINLDE